MQPFGQSSIIEHFSGTKIISSSIRLANGRVFFMPFFLHAVIVKTE
jgi:hypothetical protein